MEEALNLSSDRILNECIQLIDSLLIKQRCVSYWRSLKSLKRSTVIYDKIKYILLVFYMVWIFFKARIWDI